MIIFFTLSLVVLFIVRIYLVIELAVMNFEHSEIESELTRIQNENIRLREIILYESSLKRIEQKARLDGFVDGQFYYENN